MIYSTFKIDGKQVTKTEYIRLKRLELFKPKKKNDRPSKKNNRKNKRSRKQKVIVKPIFESYQQYLGSPQWKKIRKRILKRANYKCEICKIMKAYQVHHKHYKNIFNEKDKDLIAICGTCHQDKHKILTDEQIEKRVNKMMELEGYL